MSMSALISMVLILGIIMGGFVFFLRIAIKKEKQKDA